MMMLPPGCERRCPACAHRSFSKSESESQKLSWLKRALAPWSERIEAVRGLPEDQRWAYRDKVCLRAEWSAERSQWRFGLLVRQEGSVRDYELVAIPDCPVHSRRVQAILTALSGSLPGPRDLALAFVVITGELATLVVKAPKLSEELESRLRDIELAQFGVRGFFVNLNPSAGERVFSNRGWKLLAGSPRASADGMPYGPGSFQQVLPILSSDALREASQYLAPSRDDSIVDLCSGAGFSVREWLGRGAETIGVELSGEAVACVEAGLGRAVVLRGRVSERVPQLEAWAAQAAQAVMGRRLLFANPPRLGLEREAVDWIRASYRPERLAYLSCSAGTLNRDLSLLTEAGYRLERIIPYDFFPQTSHVEALALLERA